MSRFLPVLCLLAALGGLSLGAGPAVAQDGGPADVPTRPGTPPPSDAGPAPFKRDLRLTPKYAAPVAPPVPTTPPSPLFSDTPPTIPAVSAFSQVVVPERTEITLILDKDLKSGATKIGAEVPYRVARDVYSPGPAHLLLIPAGAHGYGKVTQSRRRGLFGRGGRLEFTCEYVVAPDGTRIPLRSGPVQGKGHGRPGGVVAAVVFPPLLLLNGRDVTVHQGREVTAYVNVDTLVGDLTVAQDRPVPAPAGQTLFSLADGSELVGSLVSFDGTAYTVRTPTGSRSLAAADVRAMRMLSADTPAPSSSVSQ